MSINKQLQRSLIICMTPLQMLIGQKIIELDPNKKFDLLVIAPEDNYKYKHYYNEIKKLCFDSLYYISSGTGLNDFFKYITQFKISHLNKVYRELYIANVNDRRMQYMVSKYDKSDIFTFDDGIANITSSSGFYSNSKPKLLKRAVWRVLGIKYYIANLKEKSLLHYTIYKDIPNIIENKQYISLIPLSNEKQSTINDKVIKFYIGQPLTDISNDFDLSFVKNNVDKLEVDYYYPHPREKVYPEGSYQIVESPLIFEDYIVQFLKDNPYVSIEVFSFTSTVLLNIMSLDRIQATYIHNNQFFKLHRSFYDFSEEVFGIPHLDLDSILSR